MAFGKRHDFCLKNEIYFKVPKSGKLILFLWKMMSAKCFELKKKVLEMPSIDLGTSHMLSERSTIWATSPMLMDAVEAVLTLSLYRTGEKKFDLYVFYLMKFVKFHLSNCLSVLHLK